MEIHLDKVALERGWNERRYSHIPSWGQTRELRRVFLSDKKQLVAWTVEAGRPVILALLKVIDIRISFTRGITIVMESSAHGHPIELTTAPREHIPGIYWWLPAFGDVRHTPMVFDDLNSVKRLTLTMCIRTAAAFGDQTNHTRHVGTLKEFKERWPNIL